LVIGAAVGSAASLLLLLLVVVVVFFTRRRLFSSVATSAAMSEMELLVTEKVTRMFALAFAGKFDAAQLAAAEASFAALEVPRKCVKLERLVGQGQWGEVHAATLFRPTAAPLAVAVKMVHQQRDATVSSLAGAGMAGQEALQLEARLLHQLRHPHIVQVLATVTFTIPTLVCLEFMHNGDLKTYLRLRAMVVFFFTNFFYRLTH
jgi:hypothetical protein